MSIELKIKSKHLAEESRIIRFEEKKLKSQVRYQIQEHYKTGSNEPFKIYLSKEDSKRTSLHMHRIFDVRREARATLLARAFIEGKSYQQVEGKRKEEKEWEFQCVVMPRVVKMVQKYHDRKTMPEDVKETLKEWANVKNIG